MSSCSQSGLERVQINCPLRLLKDQAFYRKPEEPSSGSAGQ